MRTSNIVIVLLTLALLFASLTACTAQTESTDENLESAVPPIKISGSVSQDFPQQITNEIASLVSLDFLGLKYSDNVTNEFVLNFIYHLAMQSYFDRAKAYDGAVFDKSFQYVAFTKDEMADILNLAFGERFSIASLTINPAETINIIYDSDMYYVSIGETVLINIEYLSNHDENTAVYSYKVESSTTIANGEVTVEVVSSSNNSIGVSIASMLVDERSRVSDEEPNVAYDLITDLIPKAATFYGAIFNGGGSFEVDKTVTIPGFDYYALVVDDDIKSIADLKAWVESIITPEVAKIRFYGYIEDLDLPLSSFDAHDYSPLYYEYDGKLYVDTGNGGHGFAFAWLYDTLKITSLTDTIITAEIDRTLFDEFDETSVIKLEKREGHWLIANDFIDQTDEDISRLSAMAFADILRKYPPEEGGFDWGLLAPDEKAEFFWGGNKAGLLIDTRPFEAAGLDVAKLDGAGNSLFTVYVELDRDANKKRAMSNFRGIVYAGSEKVSYDAESGYFSFDVGNGNIFKWTKDMSNDGMDVIFELNPKLLIEAGLNPNGIDGWKYTKVKVNIDGAALDEWKLVKSF